ncbi:hypothetical protein [Nocardia nova]|uniref:hypothetical protein n=1 Tax=Nocardia nova TaxID=37330 RepID=UPI0033C6A4D3
MKDDSGTPRPVGRPRKNGRRVGFAAPSAFADAISSWGPEYRFDTDRVEALVKIGLKVAPRHHRPITASYTGEQVHVYANLTQEIASKVLGPVRAKRTSITRRMMTLLHYAMVAEGVELALEAAGMLPTEQPLERTGTM